LGVYRNGWGGCVASCSSGATAQLARGKSGRLSETCDLRGNRLFAFFQLGSGISELPHAEATLGGALLQAEPALTAGRALVLFARRLNRTLNCGPPHHYRTRLDVGLAADAAGRLDPAQIRGSVTLPEPQTHSGSDAAAYLQKTLPIEESIDPHRPVREWMHTRENSTQDARDPENNHVDDCSPGTDQASFAHQ